MRYAIVDNSTLTAVQRLLGEIEVESSTSIDGDIAAFETLIQTILFYDKMFYVDDYKEQFRETRKKFFSFMTPLRLEDNHYNELMRASTEFVDDISLRVKSGKIEANEVGNFLEQISMHSAFTWDLSSSEWFLTMKMLRDVGGVDIEKYSALNDMIFLELKTNRESIPSTLDRTDHYEFIGSDGKVVSRGAVSNQLSAFASGINWLAMRTCFYTYLSYHYDADAILHPIRSAFQLSIAGKFGLPKGYFELILKRFSDEASSAVKTIKNVTDPLISEMPLPLLSAWVVDKAASPRASIEVAFNLREERAFREARTRLSNLAQTLKTPDRNSVRDANLLVEEIKKAGDVICQLYGAKTQNGLSVSPLISIFNTLGSLKGFPALPNVPLKVRLPDKVIEIGLRHGFKGVFRSVVQDLVAISRLGAYHEKISANVRYKGGEKITYHAKIEERRFLGKTSHWKRPM